MAGVRSAKSAMSTGMLQRLKKWARSIKQQTMTLWFCCRNPRTPWPVKWLCILVVSYALSPIDLIPDFIPVLGLLDDLILLPAAIWLIIRLVPEEVYRESRDQARTFENSKKQRPGSRLAGAVIIGVWLLLALMFVRHFWR